MMELIIVVDSVTIKQQQRAAFDHMSNLSIKELNLVVKILTIKQQQKATFKDMWNMSMKELNTSALAKSKL